MVALANGFASRGFDVDLVLAAAVGPYLADLSPSVKLYDLGAARVGRSLFPLIRYLWVRRPAVMLSFMGHANVIAIMAAKLSMTGVRVVVSEHSSITGEYDVATGFSERAVFKLIPFLYPRADAVCSVSEGAARDLERFVRLNTGVVRTIHNPFDLDRIAERAAETVCHPWITSGDMPVILAVGRLHEVKGFEVLLEALHSLRKKRPVRLMILGEGEMRSDLEEFAARLGLGPNDFQMPGFAANPYAWMSVCSVFVLSSRREALPGVVIEAMACGAPIVSTDCVSGPSEILVGGLFGTLVPVGDVEALAEGIDRVLQTPRSALPDVKARAADFGQEASVDSYLDLFGLPRRVSW